MSVDQILQQKIKDTQVWLSRENEESVYKRDLKRRIELINWVLENMKNSDINIFAVIESKMNEIIDEINKKHTIIEQDPLDSELRILDWILYQVCSKEIKRI
jgi:hypothetical protein